MTAYRDPMPDPFAQAAVDALAARETREHAREAAWQAGRAEALRAIAAFDVAVAPARLRIDNKRGVDGMRTKWAHISLFSDHRTHLFAYVIWNGDGWLINGACRTSTFEAILLAAMKAPEFADALVAMQRKNITDEVTPPTPAAKRSALHVVGSLVLALLLCGVCLVLVVALRHVFPVLFW